MNTNRLATHINAVLRLAPEEPAIEFRGVWRSWGHLLRTQQAFEDSLTAVGTEPGTRVGVILRNSADLVPVILALLTTNRCLVTLNASMPDARLAADISESAPAVLVACASDWQRTEIRDTSVRMGVLGISIGEHPGNAVEEVIASHATSARHVPGIAIEMLTSGTTGKPKRIPLKHTSFESMIFDAARFERGRAEDNSPQLRRGVQIIVQPFAHISGLLALTNAIVAGRRCCILEKFSVSAFTDAVVRHRPRVAYAPPAGIRMILESRITRDDLSSLLALRTGAAPVEAELVDAFYERYGVPILQNYGATEFAGGVAGWTLADFKDYWSRKRGSVGRLNPGIEARVVDPTSSAALGWGEVGLLELKGKQISQSGDWVRTTDLASLDGDSFLWIRGRADNAIIRGGFKIEPNDIVQALQQHAAVREAAAIGLADTRLGQVPAAGFVAKKNCAVPSEVELQEFLRAKLLPYQIPVRIRALPELPRTSTMKIDQAALRAQLE